ncbi:unnamed protein product, partial [Phaeothamnion confervicola]
MNKLLRNPWVVGGLVIGMAALWWVQMRSVFYPGTNGAEPVAMIANDTASDTVGSENTDGIDTAVSLAIEPLSAQPRRPTELRWHSTAVRDPFGPLVASVAVVTPPPVAAAPAEPLSVPVVEVAPTLEAVLNTPSAHIAVIDGRIVRVGDEISGRPVLKIGTASVALGRG